MSATIECSQDLIANPRFHDLARAAVAKGKKYTKQLLAFAERHLVLDAIEFIANEYALYQIEMAKAARNAAARARRQEERERPTREIIEAAYNECGYRQCKQGHRLEIIVSLTDSPSIINRGGKYYPIAHSSSRRDWGDRYSSRCRHLKRISIHTLYVRENYLQRMRPLGAYTIPNLSGKKQLILDCEKFSYAVDSRPLYSIRYVWQGNGTDLWCDSMIVAVRPFSGVGAAHFEQYTGEFSTKFKICDQLGIGRDTPDAPMVDMAIEKGLLRV